MNHSRPLPEDNRILFVRNLAFQTTGNEIYQLFGRYGSIRQVRMGVTNSTRGTAFVVFEDMQDARRALESMKGFKVGERYIAVLYYSSRKTTGYTSTMPENLENNIDQEPNSSKRKVKVQL